MGKLGNITPDTIRFRNKYAIGRNKKEAAIRTGSLPFDRSLIPGPILNLFRKMKRTGDRMNKGTSLIMKKRDEDGSKMML